MFSPFNLKLISSVWSLLLYFITLAILNGTGQLFCSVPLRWVFLMSSHYWIQVRPFGREIIEVMLTSQCTYQEALLSTSPITGCGNFGWLGWCLPGFSSVSFNLIEKQLVWVYSETMYVSILFFLNFHLLVQQFLMILA